MLMKWADQRPGIDLAAMSQTPYHLGCSARSARSTAQAPTVSSPPARMVVVFSQRAGVPPAAGGRCAAGDPAGPMAAFGAGADEIREVPPVMGVSVVGRCSFLPWARP